jgi:hypothetical protein
MIDEPCSIIEVGMNSRALLHVAHVYTNEQTKSVCNRKRVPFGFIARLIARINFVKRLQVRCGGLSCILHSFTPSSRQFLACVKFLRKCLSPHWVEEGETPQVNGFCRFVARRSAHGKLTAIYFVWQNG